MVQNFVTQNRNHRPLSRYESPITLPFSPILILISNLPAFDETTLICYVKITQVFALWFIPFHRVPVSLVAELQLVRPPSSRKYYIQSQNDLYQTSEFVKFVAPLGIASTFVALWGYAATLMCVLGALLFAPLTWAEEAWAKKGQEVGRGRAIERVDGVDGLSSQLPAEKREGQFGSMQVVKPD